MERPSLTELPDQAIEAMVAHARFCYPKEACGLLAGVQDDSGLSLRMVYALTNADDSSVAYTIEPTEHFRALQHAERNGWELIGAFHSHPSGAGYPSHLDVTRATEPGWAWCVVGLSDPLAPDIGVFTIENGQIRRTYPPS